MSILACSGFEEGPGANFTPPTLGNFMEKQKSDSKRLREARAGALVTREGRRFHEKQARRFGIHTNRGLAHFRASKMYTREGNRLQEMFEQSGGQGQLPPKAIMKASKAAMLFHKKQAEKAGLDSDLGHAHVAAMEHHADMFKKAKTQHQQAGQQQQGMGEAGEGGPGSGPRKSSAHPADTLKLKMMKVVKAMNEQLKTKPHHHPDVVKLKKKADALAKQLNRLKYSGESEANMGHSGRQTPVPVPKKSEQPSDDIHQNKPPIKLKQNESSEGGPGSGPRGSSAEKRLNAMNGRGGRYSKPKQTADKIPYDPSQSKKDLDKRLDRKELTPENFKKKYGYSSDKESGRGPDQSMSNTFPSKVKKQVKDELIFRGKKQKMFDPRKNRDKSMRSRESRQDDDTPKRIDLREFYKQPESGQGWRNSNVYSPTRLRESQQTSGVVIKEY